MSEFIPTERQKKILSMLLDKYEGSLTYTGENQKRQTFSVAPEKVYPEYDSNFEPMEKVCAFEKEMRELEDKGLVTLSWKNNVIIHITAADGRIRDYYEIVKRREKRDIINDETEFYRSYLGKNQIVDDFVNEQLKRVTAGKNGKYTIPEASDMIKLLLFIIRNHEEVLERELSVYVLGDSKLFEKKYRKRIVKILKKHVSDEDDFLGICDEREQEIEILGKYGILTNPSNIWIKGRASICFDDDVTTDTYEGRSIGLSSDTVARINKTDFASSDIMTVENLTSFNRISPDDTSTIFLGGYHNRIKEQFLLSVSKKEMHRWYHFGDIDPDGFMILERLKKRTGIDFRPYHMGIEDLKKYAAFAKPLEKNDIVKAVHLSERGVYPEIMQYMLKHNVKLEQEIISMQMA